MNIDGIWVHGINNDRQSAEHCRARLNNESGLKFQAIFHNATGLQVPVTGGSNWSGVREAKTQLRNKLGNNLANRVTTILILHSYGTFIAKLVLKKLQPTHGEAMKELLHIRAYGGVVLLPDTYGSTVYNYLVPLDRPAAFSFVAFNQHEGWGQARGNDQIALNQMEWRHQDEYECRVIVCGEREEEHNELRCHNFEHAYIRHAINEGKQLLPAPPVSKKPAVVSRIPVAHADDDAASVESTGEQELPQRRFADLDVPTAPLVISAPDVEPETDVDFFDSVIHFLQFVWARNKPERIWERVTRRLGELQASLPPLLRDDDD